MSANYLSLTELGRIYGVSRNKVGQWLVAIGLRTKEKRPSPRAFHLGFVQKKESIHPGTYFWVWHGEKTRAVLDRMLAKDRSPSVADACHVQDSSSQVLGPFSVRESGNIGQEILNADGKIIAWTTDRWVAQVICKLLTENQGLLGDR